MYHHIRGTLVRLAPSEAVIEAGGVGYRVEITFPVFQALEGATGQTVLLYLAPYFREDVRRLFGFLAEEDRDFFRLITGVRGFGPAHALSLLSGLPRGELHEAIVAGDSKALQRVRGIGRKNAERLIVELKERLPPVEAGAGAGAGAGGGEVEMARLALEGIGYSRAEAVAEIEKVRKRGPEAGAAAWIKAALRSRA